MMSSVLVLPRALRLKSAPNPGMSPRIGILLSVAVLLFSIRPPIMTVWPSGVTTTVSAERLSMTGAKTGLLPVVIGSVLAERLELSGETLISTMTFDLIMVLTCRMIPMSWYWIVLI